MNEPKTIKINDVEYATVGTLQDAKNDEGLPFVIVRCRDAGVHAGYLKRSDEANRVAELVGARRLWRWHGRTLSGLAIEGTDDPSRCKFGDPVDITVAGWCEIIPCTDAAKASLLAVERWVNGC